jgi:hypothetical protein
LIDHRSAGRRVASGLPQENLRDFLLMNHTFGINDCIRSFKYAFSGLFHLVRSQHNA